MKILTSSLVSFIIAAACAHAFSFGELAKNVSESAIAASASSKNIEELKKRRLEIIEAYCDKVDGKYVIQTEIKETVTPNNPRISNGSINTYNRDKSGMPVFKSLIGDDRGFGILNTTDEIEEQLKNGDI